MSIYKDTERNTWYVVTPYTDYDGKKKQKKKRGFKTKREAQIWENDFLVMHQKDVTLLFKALAEHYLKDEKQHLKPSTYETKVIIISTHILPYFADMAVSDITPLEIRKWQNKLKKATTKRGTSLSQSYIHSINTILCTIFNHAIKFYGLKENPCSIAGSVGSPKPKQEMSIWTVEQFNHFLKYEDDPIYKMAFILFFYTGMRKGELLALEWGDIDFNNKVINITKSLQRIRGKDVVTSPKTSKSERTIVIFDNLIEILKKYKSFVYDDSERSRVFPTLNSSNLYRRLKKKAKEADLNEIRIHDLRHSHASLLIELGFSPLVIADRLGHESVQTTLDRYSHLYPNKQQELADKLQEISIK